MQLDKITGQPVIPSARVTLRPLQKSDKGLLATLKRWGDKCVNPEYERVRPAYEKWKVEEAAKPKEPKPVRKKRKGKSAA